jgi:hypothetical protein
MKLWICTERMYTSPTHPQRALTENMVLKNARIILTRAQKVSGMMLNLHGDLLLPRTSLEIPKIRNRIKN